MRSFLTTLMTSIALLCSVTCLADDERFSGPQVGEKITPFKVLRVTGPFDAATSGTAHTRDFGPAGAPLADNGSLRLEVSGPGATGFLTWEAYQKQVATLAASAT